jgi:hypothetical protein
MLFVCAGLIIFAVTAGLAVGAVVFVVTYVWESVASRYSR